MKRWPVIRHVRWIWYSYQLMRWWKQVGQYYWLYPNPEDLHFLKDVREGRA